MWGSSPFLTQKDLTKRENKIKTYNKGPIDGINRRLGTSSVPR